MAASLLLGHIDPAAAAVVGHGVATGTEDQLDVGATPTNGTIDTGSEAPSFGPIGVCAKAADDEFTPHDGDNLSAEYTLVANDGTLALASSSYEGTVTISVQTEAVFYFGPQGTHYGPTLLGNDCGADNLGQLSPVPANVTVSGTGFSCSASADYDHDNDSPGSFWREAGDAFGVTATFSAGSDCGETTLDFVGVFQPPCGFLVDCITGAYVQQD